MVEELADYVRKTQPNALLCSRIGHGMGDYESKGDMEVPPRNIEGLWETCDTTNDSWSYAWYDQNWKDAKEILHRLVSTVGRGGTYLFNIGPDGKGRVPAPAAKYLSKAGEWIQRYPQVVYSGRAVAVGPRHCPGAMSRPTATRSISSCSTGRRTADCSCPDCRPKSKPPASSPAGKLCRCKWAQRGTWTELQVPPAPRRSSGVA